MQYTFSLTNYTTASPFTPTNQCRKVKIQLDDKHNRLSNKNINIAITTSGNNINNKYKKNSFTLFEWTFAFVQFKWAVCPKLITLKHTHRTEQTNADK